jgi:HK97 family phage portal protein
VEVSADSALRLGAVFRAVSLLSSSVGTLPCKVFREDSASSGKVVDKTDPRFRIVRRKANREMSAATFRQTLTAHALLRGNGYAFIVRDRFFQPVELWPLNPDATYPARDKSNGTLWYVTQSGSQFFRVPDYDVLHIHGLGFDGLSGYSVIQYCAHDMGLATASRDYASKFFANGAQPSGVIEVPGQMSQATFDRLRASWANMHEGVERAHKVGILEEGCKWSQTSINARDAQLIEERRFSLLEIANWFGVPPHMVGDNSRTAYNSIEAENQSYLDVGLNPWLVRWEDEYNAKLFTEEEQESSVLTAEFERKALVRADLVTRGNFYRVAVGGPFMTPNEARAAENMPPVDGGNDLLPPQGVAAPAGGDDPDMPIMDGSDKPNGNGKEKMPANPRPDATGDET